MLALDAFILFIGFRCVCKPEELCKRESWKSDGEFNPSEQYIDSIRYRGVLLVGVGLIILIAIAVMIYFGIKEGKSFTVSEFFEGCL